MKIFANLDTQEFVWNFRTPSSARHIFSQGDGQPLTLYLVRDSGRPGGGYPFTYDLLSGLSTLQLAVITLRDCRSFPVNLGSTDDLTKIRDGFQGVFNLNTAAINTFLTGVSERECAFCIDLVDVDSNKIKPFRSNVLLRAVPDLTGGVGSNASLFYLPEVVNYTGEENSLESIVTDGVALNSIFTVVIDGSKSDWRLEDSTLDSDPDSGVIKVADTGLNLIRVGGL